MSPLRSPLFWLPALLTLLFAGSLFAWELGYLHFIASPIRPDPSVRDLIFTVLLTILLSLTTGLGFWRSRKGTCPIGSRSAIGIGGAIGAVALLCPVCLILPFSIVGLGALLALLAPFVPLLQIIALIILITALFLLWPRQKI